MNIRRFNDKQQSTGLDYFAMPILAIASRQVLAKSSDAASDISDEERETELMLPMIVISL